MKCERNRCGSGFSYAAEDRGCPPAFASKKMGCDPESRTPNFCLITAAPAGRLGPGLPCDELAAAARLAAGVALEAGPVTYQRKVAALGAAVSFVTLEPRGADL